MPEQDDKTQITTEVSEPVDKTVEENVTPPVGSEIDTPEGKVPVLKSGDQIEDKDPLARIEELQAEKDVLEKRHKDAERKITELGQDRSETRKNFDQMSGAILELREQFAQATKKPLPTTEEFIAEINSKGVEPIMKLINEATDEKMSKVQERLDASETRNQQLELNNVKESMERDEVNYPGFKELWPEMQKLSKEENVPINYNAGPQVALHALYKLTKADHSGDAIQAAEKAAVEKTEEKLAREANAGVASGGKKGTNANVSEADMRKMPTDKLRKLVEGMHGIADRD